MLSEAVLRTVKYFDVQEHCLTLIEIGKYLLEVPGLERREYSLSEIQRALEQDLKSRISYDRGFYFLSGRESLVRKRLDDNFYASKRLRRARKFLPKTRHIPFVSAVSVDGSEAVSNSKQGSDIDLLIITQTNRIWLARLTVTFYFQTLGMRRHGKLIADRFCLNHYVATPKYLDSDHNLYTAVEYISQIPYFGGEVAYQFLQNNIGWIRQYLHQPYFEQKQTPAASVFKKFVEKIFANRFGDWLEKIAGVYQLSRIEIQDYITVEPDELSFHPGSKGQRVLKRAGL